jgi:hypothetical protein
VITQPTSVRILEVLQTDLQDNVMPMVTDPQLVANLQMMHHVLGTLAIRAENEIAWLVEEVGELERFGAEVVAAHPQASRVAIAVADLKSVASQSLRLSDVVHRYSLATEILSCALEELPEGSELRRSAESHLDARLAHEVAIIGEFQLVGRS